MTNYVDSTGLHTETREEIVAALETAFRDIYGQDIALNADSPDKQMIELFAQAKIDMLEVIADVYNSFDPRVAIGQVLDARAALTGVFRRAATYTLTMVSVTLDRQVTLQGLDTSDKPFTVSNPSGSKFLLMETTTKEAGTHSLAFRAENAGLVDLTTNSLTNIVTIILGVTATNNPTAHYQTGQNEETDPEFRVRRRAAVALPSTGYLEGLQGALASIDGVTDVKVFENNTDATDVYGIPEHSIWAIVDGGADADIADAIIRKRNGGCGMRGDEVVAVTQVNGLPINIKFDRPIYADLYIDLTVTSLDNTHDIDEEYLKEQIFEQVEYGIYEPSDTTEITALLKTLDPYVVVTDAGVSGDDVTYEPFLYPDTVQHRWIISTTRINITVV
jgi:uncharacterized phage protein gp47/JayE